MLLIKSTQGFCRHTCEQCGSVVSHYHKECNEPIVLTSSAPQHPDCLAIQKGNVKRKLEEQRKQELKAWLQEGNFKTLLTVIQDIVYDLVNEAIDAGQNDKAAYFSELTSVFSDINNQLYVTLNGGEEERKELYNTLEKVKNSIDVDGNWEGRRVKLALWNIQRWLIRGLIK